MYFLDEVAAIQSRPLWRGRPQLWHSNSEYTTGDLDFGRVRAFQSFRLLTLHSGDPVCWQIQEAHSLGALPSLSFDKVRHEQHQCDRDRSSRQQK